jgi:hypothetical protein
MLFFHYVFSVQWNATLMNGMVLFIPQCPITFLTQPFNAVSCVVTGFAAVIPLFISSSM